MTTATLTAEETAALNEHVNRLKSSYAALSKADNLTKEDEQLYARHKLKCFESDFADYGPVRLRPDVPKQARALYVKLFKLVNGERPSNKKPVTTKEQVSLSDVS